MRARKLTRIMQLLSSRILMSMGMIVFVGALAAGATGAFFSDTETSTGNTFAAGAIDLTIDNTSYGFDWNRPGATNPTGVWGLNPGNSWQLDDLTNQLFFSFQDLKPGDYGEDTISMHVQNAAYACMAFDLTATPENNVNEPEADFPDLTVGADEGELQKYLDFVFWYDDGDNVLEEGEEQNIIPQLSGLPGSVFTGQWLAIADSQNGTPLAPTVTNYIGKGWCFGEMTVSPVDRLISDNTPPAPGATGFTCSGVGNHNDAQTDGITVDVHFYAEQSRNNGQFLCANLPPVDPQVANRPLGAALASYDDPATCDAVVDDSFAGPVAPNFNTIQAAIDDATTAPGETICVNSGTYAEVVNVNKSVTIAGVGAVGSALVNGGFIIDADNVTVKGFEVTGGNTEGTFAGFYIKSGVDNLDVVFNDIDGPGVNDAGGSRGIVNTSGSAITDVLVENNTIHEWTSGIYMNPDANSQVAPWLIRYNDIDDNTAGIGNVNSAIVAANEFNHSLPAQEAIGAGTGSFGDFADVTIEFNNLLGGTKINTYPDPTIAVVAENNFFNLGGATQAPANVDFTPETLVMYPHN